MGKHGLQLTLGTEGQPDSRSASSPWLVQDGNKWHMFYVGTQFCTPVPDRIPSTPYVTLKAEADHPAGPWRKRYDIIPFSNEAGTYYSDTASPGDVVEQDGEFRMFFGAAAFTAPGKLGRTVGIARTKDLNGSWRVDPQPIFPSDEQCENTSLYYEKAMELGSCSPTTSGSILRMANTPMRSGCTGPKIWITGTKKIRRS